MARPYTAHELIPELQFWVKHPTDPSLRKLLRKTVATLKAFTDLVGEYESEDIPASESLPTLVERIEEAE
jgi:hypothetical protein